MASVTINTNLTQVTDSQSTKTSAVLDGVPNTSSTIITNRTFTPNANCTFAKIPHVSFTKTSDPNRYSYSVVKNTDGSYSFTVNYFRPLSPPTTDIIEFFAEAKTNATILENRIYGWNMITTEVFPYGETRTLVVTGDPGAQLKIAVTNNPLAAPIASETFIVSEYIATIGQDGTHSKVINFPLSTVATEYRVVLTKYGNNIFTGGLPNSPTTIFLNQWPYQQTKLEIIETSDTTWVAPFDDTGLGKTFYYYSGLRGSKTLEADFSFTCTHSADITVDGTFTADDFTQVTGQGATITNGPGSVTQESLVTYKDLTTTIDNTASPNSVVISGKITIEHGYDAGGHTYITLNVNDILNHL
tara:strand:+ start:260 stop:1333 length:1074 start_codon:yes stop_codon:yes gene_type:complete